MTSNPNPPSNQDIPPNPFAAPTDLPMIPSIPGMDVQGSRKAPITSHGVLLIVVIVIAAGALWGMRFIGIGSARKAEAITPDLQLTAMTPILNDHQAVLADLNATRTTNQVANEELKKNPFEFAKTAKADTEDDEEDNATPAGKDAVDPAKAAAAAKLKNIETEFAKLRLQGVMGGTTPIARIDGQVYRLGQQVGEFFTIMDMEGRTVTLVADGKQYVLTMDK